MCQGSALGPLLFVIVTEALHNSHGKATLNSLFRVALPRELLYTDDLVVIPETEG